MTKVNFGVQNRDIGPADKIDNFERQIVSKTLDDRTYLTGTATAKSSLWDFYKGDFWISKKNHAVHSNLIAIKQFPISLLQSRHKRNHSVIFNMSKNSLVNCLVKRGEWLTNTSCYIWIEKTSEIFIWFFMFATFSCENISIRQPKLFLSLAQAHL